MQVLCHAFAADIYMTDSASALHSFQLSQDAANAAAGAEAGAGGGATIEPPSAPPSTPVRCLDEADHVLTDADFRVQVASPCSPTTSAELP